MNADYTKRLLRKKDTQQLWSGLGMMAQKGGLDPVRAYYAKGLESGNVGRQMMYLDMKESGRKS
jgi:hypothetical protein